MEEKKAKLFVNSPNALDGNYESKLDTSSAEFMAKAGVADFIGDEETIANGVRQLVSMLPSNNEEGAVYTDNQDDLNRVCADMSAEIADAALALTDISDDGLFVEVKSEYAALQSSVEQAAARGYVDTIINPEDTRKYIIAAFEMLFDKREVRADKKHGTV